MMINRVLAVAWVVASAAGSGALMLYENAPGPYGAPPQRWPSSSRIKPVPDCPTLVMLAHPRCPCTRASLGELAILMARCQSKLRAYVLFTKPAGLSPDWEKTDLWRTAAAIPGAIVISDENSVEAKRFGAETSGQTLLFDRAGKLLFSGGITATRGHFGDNAGLDAIVSLVGGEPVKRSTTSVFGCTLCDPEQDEAQSIIRN